jgi:hypothetical protein
VKKCYLCCHILSQVSSGQQKIKVVRRFLFKVNALFVTDKETLLEVLSDNYSKQTQFNAVITLNDKMDRVGFEPTTSAHQQLSKMLFITYLKGQLWKENLLLKNPTHSTLFLFACSVVACTFKRSFEKKLAKPVKIDVMT